MDRWVCHLVSPVAASGHDELMIASIKIHDQEILKQDGRGARSSEVIAYDVCALPDHLTGLGVQASRSGDPKGDIHPIPI